jgi:CO dehydrogenase nickel-insertion accessory protein CooC1
MNVADKVVVVTEHHSASVYATKNLVANINGVNGEKFFFICNKFDKDDSNALISPSDPLKFTVSDYVDQFLHYDQMKCDELAQDSGIQRTAVLVM